jgi:CheY-like chemotaxis protein
VLSAIQNTCPIIVVADALACDPKLLPTGCKPLIAPSPSELFTALYGGLKEAAANNSQEELANQEQLAPLVDNTPVSGERVLIVEDNRVNQQLVAKLLTKRGYAVSIVENGLQAIEAYKREDISLILMDCQMPVMSGLEATSRIRAIERATNRHVPIVAFTANAMEGDRESCLSVGMDAYLSKPVRTAELYVTIAALITAEKEREDRERSPTSTSLPN